MILYFKEHGLGGTGNGEGKRFRIQNPAFSLLEVGVIVQSFNLWCCWVLSPKHKLCTLKYCVLGGGKVKV